MTGAAWLTLAVICVTVWSMWREWLAPSLAVTGALVVLLVANVLTAEQALAGFSNPAPVTVAALFVLARAVEKTGALQPLLAAALARGGGQRTTLARLLFPVAAASAFVNNTPVVAMLAPQVATWAEHRGRPVSWYLMPISFATILGGMATLIGTSTNLVVSGLLETAGQAPLGMFELTPYGLPIAIVGVGLLVLLAPALLPDRRGILTTFEDEHRGFSVEMEVVPGGPVDGVSVEAAGLRNLQGVYMVRIERDGRVIAPVGPDEVLRGGDRLVFVGRADLVIDLHQKRGLRSAEYRHASEFRDDAHAFYEVVVSTTSPLVGETLASAGFRERYQAAVMAIHRSGARVKEKLGQVELRPGDTLLLLAKRGFRDRWKDRRDFLVVAELNGSMPVSDRRSLFVIGLTMTLMVLAATGVLPILEGALLGAVLMVLTGTLTPNETARSIDLNVVLLIGSAFGLGAAMQSSGLADLVAQGVVVASSFGGSTVALAAVVGCTILLTELITNSAAAILMFPIAMSTAEATGGEPRSFAIAIAIAASASFLTPVGYQTNAMVYGLGAYRVRDFARLGAPMTLVTVVLLMLLLTA